MRALRISEKPNLVWGRRSEKAPLRISYSAETWRITRI